MLNIKSNVNSNQESPNILKKRKSAIYMNPIKVEVKDVFD